MKVRKRRRIVSLDISQKRVKEFVSSIHRVPSENNIQVISDFVGIFPMANNIIDHGGDDC